MAIVDREGDPEKPREPEAGSVDEPENSDGLRLEAEGDGDEILGCHCHHGGDDGGPKDVSVERPHSDTSFSLVTVFHHALKTVSFGSPGHQ